MAKKKEIYWNYRIYKKDYTTVSGHPAAEYGIVEVYYTDDKVEGYTADFMTPWGETLEELKGSFELMSKAFKAPVMNYDDLNPKPKKKIAKKKAKKKNAENKG
jgi:hypothetical protein